MIWKANQVGDLRDRKRFALFPTRIGPVKIWLRFYTATQRLKQIEPDIWERINREVLVDDDTLAKLGVEKPAPESTEPTPPRNRRF